MIELISNGIRCAFRNKLRVILTVTGIAVGVASVVLVSSIGNIGVSAINGELTGMGMDSLVISASELDEDMLSEVKNISNVSDAMPLISKTTVCSDGNENYSTMVWGVNEDADKVIELEVICGRLINRGDVSNNQRVCIVDEALAQTVFNRSDIVGKDISVVLNGEELEFEVVGVVKNGVNMLQNMLGGFIPDFMYIPYTVMQTQTNSYKFDNITVRLDESEKSGETAAVIKNTLIAKNDTVNVENLLKQKDKMNNILGIASVALSGVAGISIIVSGISIMTVMLVAVSERTREIGIKKSIGAATGYIVAEFLSESVVLTVIGALIGIIAGNIISFAMCMAVGVKYIVDLKITFIMLTVAVAVGVLFGAYPAKKAAELNPADALRQE